MKLIAYAVAILTLGCAATPKSDPQVEKFVTERFEVSFTRIRSVPTHIAQSYPVTAKGIKRCVYRLENERYLIVDFDSIVDSNKLDSTERFDWKLFDSKWSFIDEGLRVIISGAEIE